MVRHSIPLILLCCLIGTPNLAADDDIGATAYRPSFGVLRDTLYVLDSVFLEIRLDRQMIYLHKRSGSVEKYPCSTGNPSIPDGIATRPGIFVVQSKATKAFSAAFQVYLNYWIGFDGGIGLHGLDSRSYYRHLGRRPSSHGCVRISNETGSQLFRRVPLRTVVFVHNGSSARIVKFSDRPVAGMLVMATPHDDLLEKRLAAVTALRWDDPVLATPIALSPNRSFRKIDIGRSHSTPIVQFPIRPSGLQVLTPERPGDAHPVVIRAPWIAQTEVLTPESLADLGYVD